MIGRGSFHIQKGESEMPAMLACPAKPSAVVAPTLRALLDSPDDALEGRLLEFIRQSGVKFRSRAAFDKVGWKNGPPPMIAKFWRRQGESVIPSREQMIWDLRTPLLQDEALACCCVLLWRRLRRYRADWIGGVETAAIPIVAGVLAVNRAAGAGPLNGFYLRKIRKPDGLRRLLEGVPPPRGERVLLVDDILNKGISKRPLFAYCRENGLEPAALLVVIDTQRKSREPVPSLCPMEAIFTRSAVLGKSAPPQHEPASPLASMALVKHGIQATPARATLSDRPRFGSQPANPVVEMRPEDVELVRLARDTVVFTALSRGKRRPTLGEDMRGSAGYLPFLGRYLKERGPVFTRISKREFKNGVWFNRMRGCQAVSLIDPDPGTIAEMTVKSAIATATRARKVKTGAATFHKPVWPEEVGDLSLFVYLVEQLVPTKARTVEELIAEGHEVKGWGLIAQSGEYRGVICSDLDEISDVARQVAVACRKMQNSQEIRPQQAGKITFIRMKGRWLWDPARPKHAFF
jgi:orotate phosphoribosyltransferase